MIADQIDGPCAEQDPYAVTEIIALRIMTELSLSCPEFFPVLPAHFCCQPMVKLEERPSAGCDPHHKGHLPVG